MPGRIRVPLASGPTLFVDPPLNGEACLLHVGFMPPKNMIKRIPNIKAPVRADELARYVSALLIHGGGYAFQQVNDTQSVDSSPALTVDAVSARIMAEALFRLAYAETVGGVLCRECSAVQEGGKHVPGCATGAALDVAATLGLR